MGPWELKLFNGEGGEVTETDDGLCCGDESLCEGANCGCENGVGEDAHVEVKTDSEAADKHKPVSVPGGLITGGGDHVPKQLRVLAGGGEPFMCLSREDVDGCGVGGEGDSGFVRTGGG